MRFILLISVLTSLISFGLPSELLQQDEVKKVAHGLLQKLHGLLVIGWRQKVATRARVKIEIENALDEGLPRAYSKEIYEAKCSAVFEHVYQSYQGEGRSVYVA